MYHLHYNLLALQFTLRFKNTSFRLQRGIQAMSSILKMHKKKAAKVQVKVKVSEVVKKSKVEFNICLSSDPWPIKWGFRKDNAWLVYNEDYLPRTEKLWNEAVFIGKTCKGFYCWPK